MNGVLVSVRTAPVDCWSCHAKSRIISSIELSARDRKAECSIADFTAYPALVDRIREQLAAAGANTGVLKSRYSKTRDQAYMSNGCEHCDALFGSHFEMHARYDEELACAFEGDPGDDWSNMLDALIASPDGGLFR